MPYFELPEIIRHRERTFRAEARAFICRRLTLDSNGAAQLLLEPVEWLVMDYVTARCSNSAGLEAVRFHWTNENDHALDFLKPNTNDEAEFPLASTILTDAEGLLLARPILRVLPKNKRLYLKFTGGTSGDTVDVTVWVRKLTEA